VIGEGNGVEFFGDFSRSFLRVGVRCHVVSRRVWVFHLNWMTRRTP
jgi:hypothetical protein